MTIQRLGRDHIDLFTIETHPSKSFFFTSQSNGGIYSVTTGAMSLMPRKMSGVKAQRSKEFTKTYIEDMSVYDPSVDGMTVDLGSMAETMAIAADEVRDGAENIAFFLWDPESEDLVGRYGPGSSGGGYTALVNRASTAGYMTKSFDIRRIEPVYHLNKDEMKFQQIKDVMIPSAMGRTLQKGYNFSYTNYHSLNFFTASSIPSSAVLIYNNSRGWANRPTPIDPATGISAQRGVRDLFSGIVDGITFTEDEAEQAFQDFRTGVDYSKDGPPYTPYTDFTFDFYINPRYLQDPGDDPNRNPASSDGTPNDVDYRAGTIMHVSSTFAVSLVSGSSKNANGKADGFRILLQLSHSAEYTPSEITLSPFSNKGSTLGSDPSGPMANTSYPSDLVFLSNDNSLKYNHWHHVAIRWGTNTVNDGSGSFVIDGVERGTFNIPSSSITQLRFQDNGGKYVTNPVMRGEPNALFIGNFLEGTNNYPATDPPNQIRYFFNTASIEFENFDHQPWKPTASGCPIDVFDTSGVTDGDTIIIDSVNYDIGPPGIVSTGPFYIKFYDDISGTPSANVIFIKIEADDTVTLKNLVASFNGTGDPYYDATGLKWGSYFPGDARSAFDGWTANIGTIGTRLSLQRTTPVGSGAPEAWQYKNIKIYNGTQGAVVIRSYSAAGLRPAPPLDTEPLDGYNVFRDGITGFYPTSNEPTALHFRHPLNAEIHELKIHDKYRTLDEIRSYALAGPSDLTDILFYLPPFFVMESPMRRFIRHLTPREWPYESDPPHLRGLKPDYRTTYFASSPRFDSSGHTAMAATYYTGSDGPINIQLANQVAALSVSLENFTREFIQGAYPRLYHLTESYNAKDSGGIDLLSEGLSMHNRRPFSGNQVVQSVAVNNKRNFLIMPCDNGLFQPNFDLLASGTYRSDDGGIGPVTAGVVSGTLSGSITGSIDQPYGRFVTDQKTIDFSMISLNDLVDGVGRIGDDGIVSPGRTNKAPFSGFGVSAISSGNTFGEWTSWRLPGSGPAPLARVIHCTGPTPACLTFDPGVTGSTTSTVVGTRLYTPNPLDFVQSQLWPGYTWSSYPDSNGVSCSPYYGATGDNSSNMISLFQISNLYYGDRIAPKSFTLIDPNFTGSNGAMRLTIKDDGRGGLYRADCDTPHATWNNIGNIFYEDGLVLIKSPHVYRVGSENYEIGMKGEREVHMLTLSIPCPAGEINVSNNPAYKPVPPSLDPNETTDRFVYITGVEIHDDNLNVIARATLAQPVMKRLSDEFLFRIKIDF